MFHPLTVLVTGATGQQGGALARLLLKRGHHVLAFTRNPSAPAALELKQRGAELVIGDFDDVDSLVQAMRGAQAVYAMATPSEWGPGTEVRHGRNLIDAAKLAHVRHFLYSSVASANQDTGIPHFDSKFEVERYLQRSDLDWTIIAPVFFMENFTSPLFAHGLHAGLLSMGLPHHRGLQMVPVADIAAFATRVLELPEEFLGQRIDIASDEVTGEQAAALISYVSEHKLRYEEIPLEQLRTRSEEMARMYEWFDRVGYQANIAGLRRDYPEVGWHTFEDWARAQDWSALLGTTWRGTHAPSEETSYPPANQ